MTSAAFTDILCARSATVIVSGTVTSRTIGLGGRARRSPPSSSRWRVPTSAGASRQSSRAAGVVAADLERALARGLVREHRAGRLLRGLRRGCSPGLAAGRCSVPSCRRFGGRLRLRFGGSAFAAASAASAFAGFLGLRLRRSASSFLRRTSSSGARRSCCVLRLGLAARVLLRRTGATWRGASAPRRRLARCGVGAGGATSARRFDRPASALDDRRGLGDRRGDFLDDRRASALVAPSRTRASCAPRPGSCAPCRWSRRSLISVVCLRVSVIFFVSPSSPCCLRR